MALTFSINQQAVLGLVASDFAYKPDAQIAVGVDKLRSFPDNTPAYEHGFPPSLLIGLDNSQFAPTHRVFTAAGISVVEFDNWIVANTFNDTGDGYGAVVFRSRFTDLTTNKYDYIVAFRGTDGSNAQDWYANLDLATTVWTRQRTAIMAYLSGTGAGSVDQATLGHIEFVGQSLGGALAQYAAYTYAQQRGGAFRSEDISLITFNSFGAVRGLQQINGGYNANLLAGVETGHFVVDNDLVHLLGGGDPAQLASVGGSWHVNGKDNTYEFDFAQKNAAGLVKATDGRVLKLDMVSAHRIEAGFYAGFDNFQNTLANFFRPNRIAPVYIDTPASQSIAAALSRVGNKGLTTEASATARILVGLAAIGIAGDRTEIRNLTRALLDNFYASNDIPAWKKPFYETLGLPETVRLASITLPGPLRALTIAIAIETAGGLNSADRALVWDGINSFLPSNSRLTRNDSLASLSVGEREKALMYELSAVALASNLDPDGIDAILGDTKQRDLAKALAGVPVSADALQAAFTSGPDWLRNSLAAFQQSAANAGRTGEALAALDAQLLTYVDGEKTRLGADDSAFQAMIGDASKKFITEDFGWALANAKNDFTQPFQLAHASIFGSTTFDFIPYDRIHDALEQASLDPRYGAVHGLIAEALKPVETAGETVVVSASHPANPFDQAGFDPASASTASLQLQEGQIKTFTVFLPYGAPAGGQKVKLGLQGSTDVVLVKGAETLTAGTGGQYEILIPEGEREYTLGAATLNPVAAASQLILSATLADQAGTATHLTNVELSASVTPTPPPPGFDRTILGDLAPIDFDPGTPGVQTHTDDLGNVVVDPGQPQPGRADTLFDSAGNDLVQAFAGSDVIEASRGGNDKLDGGTGRDIVSGRAGDDIVIGGADGDLLRGDAGKDKAYGTSEVTVASALAAQDAAGTGLKGDFIDGGADDDTLVGGADNDALNGGSGGDLIVGGGGDDDVDGDLETSIVSMDWSITRQVIVQPDGSTLYNRVYNNVGFLSTTPGGDDVVYGGGGADWLFTRDGNDWIDAGGGDDVVFGEAGSDDIYGDAGNDKLFGDSALVPLAQQGNDYVDGGDGDDMMNGDGGDDVLFGGAGNDQMFGDSSLAPGNDYLDGEAGDDQILGVAGDDEIFGGDGADFLQGDSGTGIGDGNDSISGDAGNDQILGEGGDDELDGGEGDDFVFGNAGGDTISGGAGNDQVAGDEGDGVNGAADTIDGGDGNDLVLGDGGDDRISGGAGFDQLQGGAGNDFIDGGSEDDVLFGEAGNDTLVGGAGSDQLVGGIGDEVLDGGSEADYLWGEAGNDRLLGGAGNDQLTGGQGDDFLDGGAGDDIYIYNFGDGRDHIADSGGIDVLYFANFLITDLRLDVGSLKIVVPGGGEVHLDDFDPQNPLAGSIEYFQFADFSLYTRQQVIQALGINIQGTPADDYLSGTALGDTIQALGGNDTVSGDAGNDTINGGPGNDLLMGGAGVDALVGGDGDDQLAGGPGNDLTLDGGSGNDFYLFGVGDGQDVAVDTQGVNGIQLLGSLGGDQVTLQRSGNDLLVLINGTTDRLTARDWFANPANWNQLVLGDGTVLDRAGVQARLVQNQAPVLAPDSASTFEDNLVAVTGNALANDFDPEGRALSVVAGSTGTRAGTFGSLTLQSNGAFSYSVNNASTTVQSLAQGQTVSDPFSYTATDNDPNGAATASSTITVSIAGRNDAPVARQDFGFAIEDMASPATGNVLANDTDVDAGSVLHAVVPPAPLNGTYGTLSLSLNGAYSYALNNASTAVQSLGEGQTVVDRFSYAVTDGIVQTSGLLDMTVEGINDAPVLSVPLADQSVNAGRSFTYTIPLGSFTDVDSGDVLSYSATLADGSTLPSWLTFNASTQTFSGSVPRDATGAFDVQVVAADGHGNSEVPSSASDIFTIAIGASGGGGGGGGGGNGGGNGNEGVGNGQDAPPPGHDDNFNDGPGTGPGHPGAQGGNGIGHLKSAPTPLAITNLPQRHHVQSAAADRRFGSDHGNAGGNGNANANGHDAAAGFTAQSIANNASVPDTSAGSTSSDGASDTPTDASAQVAAQLAQDPQYDFADLFAWLSNQSSFDAALDAGEIARRWSRIARYVEDDQGMSDEAHAAAFGWQCFADAFAAANAGSTVTLGQFVGLGVGSGLGLETLKGLNDGFARL